MVDGASGYFASRRAVVSAIATVYPIHAPPRPGRGNGANERNGNGSQTDSNTRLRPETVRRPRFSNSISIHASMLKRVTYVDICYIAHVVHLLHWFFWLNHSIPSSELYNPKLVEFYAPRARHAPPPTLYLGCPPLLKL